MRIALGIAYDGRAYHGWQSQLSGRTVQDKLEAALARFAGLATGQRMPTLCAGRTDTGVHGLMQVVHFDTDIERTPFSWVRGTNRYLPDDIAVQWAQPVPDTFHCRASALTRRYRYVLSQSPVRPSVDAGRVGWTMRALDGDAMRTAAAMLVGQHDFTSFRASACQALSPVKHLRRLDIANHSLVSGGGEHVDARDRDGAEIERCRWEFEFEEKKERFQWRIVHVQCPRPRPPTHSTHQTHLRPQHPRCPSRAVRRAAGAAEWVSTRAGLRLGQ